MCKLPYLQDVKGTKKQESRSRAKIHSLSIVGVVNRFAREVVLSKLLVWGTLFGGVGGDWVKGKHMNEQIGLLFSFGFAVQIFSQESAQQARVTAPAPENISVKSKSFRGNQTKMNVHLSQMMPNS